MIFAKRFPVWDDYFEATVKLLSSRSGTEFWTKLWICRRAGKAMRLYAVHISPSVSGNNIWGQNKIMECSKMKPIPNFTVPLLLLRHFLLGQVINTIKFLSGKGLISCLCMSRDLTISENVRFLLPSLPEYFKVNRMRQPWVSIITEWYTTLIPFQPLSFHLWTFADDSIKDVILGGQLHRCRQRAVRQAGTTANPKATCRFGSASTYSVHEVGILSPTTLIRLLPLVNIKLYVEAQ